MWKKSWPLVILGAGGFLIVDLSFFAGNVSKIPHGGWFPLLVGALVFGVLMTWRRGRLILADRTKEDTLPLRLFINRMIDERPLRIPGTAVFMTSSETTPRALQQDYAHHHVLFERVVILRVQTVGVPHVPDADRVEVRSVRYGFVRVSARYGFQDEPDIPAALRLANERGAELDLRSPSYFLSRIQLVPTRSGRGMNRFRKHLFVALQKNAVPAARYYRLPRRRRWWTWAATSRSEYDRAHGRASRDRYARRSRRRRRVALGGGEQHHRRRHLELPRAGGRRRRGAGRPAAPRTGCSGGASAPDRDRADREVPPAVGLALPRGVRCRACGPPRGAPPADEEPDHVYEDGDELPGGLHALRTPGPEPVHYCVWRETGPSVLFCSDLLSSDADGRLRFVPAEYHDDPAETRRSVERLLDVPFDVLCLDHGPPLVDDPKRAIRELLGL